MTEETHGPGIERAVADSGPVARVFVERAFAAGNLIVAAIIGLAAFRVWRPRALAIEIPAGIVVALLVASAVALAVRAGWGRALSRAAAIALLAAGLIVTSVLTLGMTFFRAVGGSGAGPGPTIYLLAVLLAVPYTLVYPIGLLLWLRARGPAR